MRAISLGLAALMVVGGLAGADTIITIKGLEIEGRVVEVTEDHVRLLVHHGEDKWGKLTIPRSAVRFIQYDLQTRLGDLAADDMKGRYGLAEWAYRMGMSDEAFGLFTEVVGKPDVPSKAHLYLAKIHDERAESKEALEHYKAYALAEPTDSAAAARIGELETAAGAPAAVPAPPSTPVPAGFTDGLETGSWRYERWGKKADVSVVKGSDGNRMLRVIMDGTGNGDKTALSTRKTLDLSGKAKAHFTINNSAGRSLQVALALITASGYYEARPVTAKREWNEDMTVDIAAAGFKCQANNWRFVSKVPDMDKVQAVLFLVYNGKQRGVFYFDEIVFK